MAGAASSKIVERHEFVRRRAEEMSPELRKLLASLGEGAVPHLGDAAGVVERVAPLRRDLIDPPDRLAVMDVACDDLRSAQRAVRLSCHEQPRNGCRHWQLATQSRQSAGLVDRANRLDLESVSRPAQHPDRLDRGDADRLLARRRRARPPIPSCGA